MYLIKKVINNNIVCSVDKNGNELMLRGLGIGYQKKTNDIVPKEKVEKIYRTTTADTSNKLQQLVSEIPEEYLAVSTKIIEHAGKILDRNLNPNIFITLTDHIDFAIKRHKDGLEYKHPLMWEIKSFYPEEFSVGLYALELINEELSISLSEYEASFLALHIVNAELDSDMGSTFQITELIQGILKIVRDYYQIPLDESSLNYARFITHLKYFGQRLFQNKSIGDDDVTFQELIKNRYPKDYECACILRNYVNEKYKHRISDDEIVFLTVHLRRITTTSS